MQMLKLTFMKRILLICFALIVTVSMQSQVTKTAAAGVNNWDVASSWSPSLFWKGVPKIYEF